MAISIVPGSARITVTTQPGAPKPTTIGGLAGFHPSSLAVNGSVKFQGGATDPTAGWVVGWIQTEWVETNWGYYRGQTEHDGSLFLQRARPPARPSRASRDTLVVGDIFTRPTDQTPIPAGPLPITVNLPFTDTPGDQYNLIERNSLTGKPNFLAEAQLEFMFCTVLTVRDPANVFHHQAAFYWNLRWQYEFRATSFPAPSATDWVVTKVAAGTGAVAGHTIAGPPTDHRFTGVLTSPQTVNSNSLAAAALHAVASPVSPNRRQSRVWDTFNVTR